MMLRTRITLVQTAFLLTLLGVLVFYSQSRLANAERLRVRSEIANQLNAWNNIVDTQLLRLSSELEALPDNDDLLRVISSDGASSERSSYGVGPASANEQPVFQRLLQHARESAGATDMEVVRADGSVVFASASGRALFLHGEQLEKILRAPAIVRSFARFSSGEARAGVARTLLTRAGASGAVALTTSAQPLIATLHGTLAADVFLIGSDGKVLASGAGRGNGWLGIQTKDVDPDGRFEVVRIDHHAYQVIMLPLTGLGNTPIATLASVKDITKEWSRERLTSLLSSVAAVAAVALFLGGMNWHLRTSFQPLNEMIRILNALSRGDASVVGPYREGKDEIGRLARTLERFRRSQQLLAETTAAKERTDSELAIARDIQSGMVPHDFAFPDHPEFTVHALMEAAKAVGGDFYDFFLIDDQRLFFLVGDVSDKGVPAALYMAITKALFKHVVRSRNLPLDEIMAQVNRQLTEDNPSEMFVTVFACILDLATGVIVYSDGGHEPPMRLHRDGRAEQLPKIGGLALGFLADYSYSTGEIRLEPGDALVLYTDGVTEATDGSNRMFALDRVTEVLSATPPGAPSEAVASTLLTSIRHFVGSAPQSDDITILVVRWNEPRQPHDMPAGLPLATQPPAQATQTESAPLPQNAY